MRIASKDKTNAHICFKSVVKCTLRVIIEEITEVCDSLTWFASYQYDKIMIQQEAAQLFFQLVSITDNTDDSLSS